MDHTETAEAVLARHQPLTLWALIGINRCRCCRRRWPCNHWHNARDIRDRSLDHAAIARMLAYVREQEPRP